MITLTLYAFGWLLFGLGFFFTLSIALLITIVEK